MKKYFSALCAIFSFGFLAATSPAADEPKAEAKPEAKPAADEVAVLKTSEGEIVVEFWRDVAPKTVENFTKLAKSGFYDGTAFHRVIKGFMIQGGDPKTKDDKLAEEWGTGDPGYKIKAEFNPNKHVRGVLSMARGGDPMERTGAMPRAQFADSAGCQFFICLDAATSLDNRYTTFGKVLKGDDVLAKIGDTKTTDAPNGEPGSRPVKKIVLESVKIVPRAEIK